MKLTSMDIYTVLVESCSLRCAIVRIVYYHRRFARMAHQPKHDVISTAIYITVQTVPPIAEHTANGSIRLLFVVVLLQAVQQCEKSE